MPIIQTGVGVGSFKVTVTGVDLTDHVRSATITFNYDDNDITAMGAVSHAHALGLRDDSMEVEFFQDYATGKVDQTINPMLGNSAGGTIVIIPAGTAGSPTSPTYTMIGIPFTYNPVDGAVGDPSMTRVTFRPAAGQFIVRGTT